MRRWSFFVLVVLGLISMSGRVLAQPPHTNSLGTINWPAYPPVGIGTENSGGPVNALHIHYNSMDTNWKYAMIRLSEGTSTGSKDNGLLGLMPPPGLSPDTDFSTLSRGSDLILHDHEDGDIIITNYTTVNPTRAWGTAIRFATTGDTIKDRPFPGPGHHDLERLTIMGNGNVGIDLPPSSTGLDSVMDQVQIGGGLIPPLGYTTPIPGLTMYGGNRFEGMINPITHDSFPVDWRGIAFNHYEDHRTGYAARFAPMPWDQLAFSDQDGGLISLGVFPWHTGDALTSNDSGVFLQLTGQQGLSMFCYEGASDPYHHLFDVWRPGFGTNRNINGLFYHSTPVYIGSGTPDFTNFANVHPDIGDSLTWLLVVNGPELAKEVFVLDTTWADYVFDPGYKLPPLAEVESFMKANRHLPDIAPASKMAKTGVPIGRTEAEITKQLEEAMLYITQLSHKIDELQSKVEDLEKQKER